MILNVNAPVSVIAQTVQTPNGPQTSVITSCQSVPDIPGNTLCNLSNNVNNKTIPILDPNCSNGGVSINNICPTSVVPLPTKPVSNIEPLTPVITSDPIQIIPVVSVIDDSGNINSISTSSWSLTLNQLTGANKLDFIATSNNVLIDKGQIKLQIQLKGRANSTIIGNGTLWAYINNNPINPSGVKFAVNGLADTNGVFTTALSSPTGAVPGYTFDIQTNISLLSQTANILSFNMSNVSIQNEKGQKFISLKQQSLFSIEIDNVPNLIIQKNPQGQSIRVYPSDDTLTVGSAGTSTSYFSPGSRGNQGYNAIVTAQPLATGDVSVYKVNSDGTKSLIDHVPSQLGSPGFWRQIATYGCYEGGNTCYTAPRQEISDIPRDSDIQIVITGGGLPGTKAYHTPVIHQDYQFWCNENTCTFTP